ncbi:DUF3969 family protein [Corallococcus coralloides]|uniref:DUF3969 family protein n=1 Tax=Corallococcus coralloides TaxID=184914 RepID=UPI001ED95FC1|nr:DUF3969 family protein [Corallococcus coralloides]
MIQLVLEMRLPLQSERQSPSRLQLATWDLASREQKLGPRDGCSQQEAPTECLSLLDDGFSFLDDNARRRLALSFAWDGVWNGVQDAVAEVLNPLTLKAMISTAMAAYMALLVMPEPVTKLVAIALTTYVIAYVGLENFVQLVRGWERLSEEAGRAVTFEELQDAGHRFAECRGFRGRSFHFDGGGRAHHRRRVHCRGRDRLGWNWAPITFGPGRGALFRLRQREERSGISSRVQGRPEWDDPEHRVQQVLVGEASGSRAWDLAQGLQRWLGWKREGVPPLFRKCVRQGLQLQGQIRMEQPVTPSPPASEAVLTLQATGVEEVQRFVAVTVLGMCRAVAMGSLSPATACSRLLGPALLSRVEAMQVHSELRHAIHLATELEDVAQLAPEALPSSIAEIEAKLQQVLTSLSPPPSDAAKWLVKPPVQGD